MHYAFKNMMKPFFCCSLRYSVLISYCLLFSVSFGMDSQETEKLSKISLVESYFQEDASIISKALESFEAAELHFFWTTGRDPVVLKKRYGSIFQVDVGGLKFGSEFPAYLGFLLKHSPAHLTVKFVCDGMTRESNKGWIVELQEIYTNRFQILDIVDVIGNLINALPEQAEILKTVFQNATCGNPAIASDIYRLIAMLYGSNPASENVENKQFTYCDVDTFCFGMRQSNQKLSSYFDFDEMCFKKDVLREANGHTNLIKALFAPLYIKPSPVKKSLFILDEPKPDPHTSFYIGRKNGEGNSNNLIKLRIIDLGIYKKFCVTVLSKMMSSRQYQEGVSGDLTLLNYFPTLHGHIARGAEDGEREFSAYLENYSSASIDINDIIYVTGPGLVDRLDNCFPLEQEYPDANAMEWHRTHYLEKGERGPLHSVIRISTLDLEPVILKEFIQYARRVSDAFYVRRFGEKHPFMMKLMDHLRTQFPYATQGFKDYIKQVYNDSQKLINSDLDVWLDKQFQNLTKGSEITFEVCETEDLQLKEVSYYIRLNHILKQLGIDRPLTRNDIDFRIKG